MEKTIENGITILTAAEGMRLTNGAAHGAVVRLGTGDTADNWWEVTQEAAERLMSEAEEELTDSEALEIILGGESDA